jgi:hypothetical protein
MPIAWWLTVVQFGYLGLRLADRWPAWAAIGVATALGMTKDSSAGIMFSGVLWFALLGATESPSGKVAFRLRAV